MPYVRMAKEEHHEPQSSVLTRVEPVCFDYPFPDNHIAKRIDQFPSLLDSDHFACERQDLLRFFAV